MSSSSQASEEVGSEKRGRSRIRRRRTAHEINRLFPCPYPGCQKSYGAESSMKKHCRLKHPDFDVNTMSMVDEEEDGKLHTGPTYSSFHGTRFISTVPTPGIEFHTDGSATLGKLHTDTARLLNSLLPNLALHKDLPKAVPREKTPSQRPRKSYPGPLLDWEDIQTVHVLSTLIGEQVEKGVFEIQASNTNGHASKQEEDTWPQEDTKDGASGKGKETEEEGDGEGDESEEGESSSEGESRRKTHLSKRRISREATQDVKRQRNEE